LNVLPLQDIRLNLASHRSVLWWTALLYRAPRQVEAAEKGLKRWQQAAIVFRFYLHLLLYFVFLGALGRWLVYALLGLSASLTLTQGIEIYGPFLGQVVNLAVGIAIGLSGGLVFGIAGGLTVGIVGGLTLGFAESFIFGLSGGGLTGALTGGLVFGLATGLTAGVAFASVGLTLGTVGGIAFGISIGSVSGLQAGIGAGAGWIMGLLTFYFRLYYLPAHLWFLWPRLKPKAYQWHPVAWDEVCPLPFPGLDRLLVAYAEHDPEAGEKEVERLIDTYPTQRQAALRAKAILVARRAGEVEELARLDEALAALPEGKKGFLADVPEVRSRVHEIVAVQARLDTLQRPFLREPYAAVVVEKIENFRNQIAGFKPPLSTELRAAAGQWCEVARRQLEAAQRASSRESTGQVFRAGEPVDRDREAFLYRDAIFHEIERQVMFASGCPGLLIYGRRRVGKTTLLQNLPGFLPPGVAVASLSMQQAAAFTSPESFTRLLAEQALAAWPSDLNGLASPQDLQGLESFLAAVDERLKRGDRRLLLAIDEFENLDVKIGEGVMPMDLLAVVRESIQRHRRIIWAFAGSHSIAELTHAPWTSYLVSARKVEIPLFEPQETRLLLTEPLKYSTLWKDLEARRPRFQPGFWGAEGIERIHAETGGWPHLVQLVAEAVVDLVNDAGGEGADPAILEKALDKAVVRGDNVLMELVERESKLPGEWDYVRGFRTADLQPLPDDEAVARSLRRRLLVVEDAGRFRLRVPLMGRWLRQRL
jgi:AAA ATPase domain